jgi:hypothetical protein
MEGLAEFIRSRRNVGERWLWIPGHGNKPSEIFFSDDELHYAARPT